MRNAYKFSIGIPEGKRPVGRPRRKWEDSVGMGLRRAGRKM
jgi:hypothetical protein